ncbi:MAG: hypothetical protein EA404_05255 [Spirochaetaceae bacterium]|nr:MAG: hypothetical protein EA404_05255 [Spirochaetaceae bacterium]
MVPGFLFAKDGEDLKRRCVREYLERRGTGGAESTGGGSEGADTMSATGDQVLSRASKKVIGFMSITFFVGALRRT